MTASHIQLIKAQIVFNLGVEHRVQMGHKRKPFKSVKLPVIRVRARSWPPLSHKALSHMKSHTRAGSTSAGRIFNDISFGGGAIHLHRCCIHDVSGHNNSVTLVCNLMFSLASRLIEKQAVDVDAPSRCTGPHSVYSHNSSGFAEGSGGGWGGMLRFHVATL